MAATPGQHPMAGQVMEAQAHQQRPPMTLPHLPPNCKNDLLLTTMPTTSASNTITAAATTAAEIAYLQQLQNTAAEANNNGGGTRGEQCPRCASHDTKFCYYNNYNTSQPRHFCRACRRYWTLGGSLRNVPIGGSTRKRPRFAHAPPPPARRLPAHVFGLDGGGSLFALGAAPLLEGRGGAGSFDLGLGLPPAAPFSAGGEVGLQVPQGLLGLRGGGGAAGASPLFWPAGLLENDGVDTWKVAGASAGGAMWPEFSAAAGPAQAGGLLHGGAQLM